jgi:hypothetical protein
VGEIDCRSTTYVQHVRMKIMTKATIVLKNLTNVDHFGDFATRSGFVFDRQTPQKTVDADIVRYIWRNKRESLTLVKNEPVRIDSVAIDAVDLTATEERVRDAFPCYVLDEVLDIIRLPEPRDRRLGFKILAVIKDLEYDQRIFDAVATSVQAAEADHTAALLAAGQLSWRQFRSVVETVVGTQGTTSFDSFAAHVLQSSRWNR